MQACDQRLNIQALEPPTQAGLFLHFTRQCQQRCFAGRDEATDGRVALTGVGGLAERTSLHPHRAALFADHQMHRVAGDAERPHGGAFDGGDGQAVGIGDRQALVAPRRRQPGAWSHCASAPSARLIAAASVTMHQTWPISRSGNPASAIRCASGGSTDPMQAAARSVHRSSSGHCGRPGGWSSSRFKRASQRGSGCAVRPVRILSCRPLERFKE